MSSSSRSASTLLIVLLAVLLGLGALTGVVWRVVSHVGEVRHRVLPIHLPSMAERLRTGEGLVPRGEKLFSAQACIGCHGAHLEGGEGPCLTDAVWLHGGTDKDLFNTLTNGVPEKGMPVFGTVLSQDDRLALIAFIRSRAQGPREVRYAAYDGKWRQLPDFSKLRPAVEGTVREGELMSLEKTGRRRNFGVVYQGQLLVPVTGDYQFELSSNGGSAWLLDGEMVISHDGLHKDKERKTATLKLTQGLHPFVLRHFQTDGKPLLRLSWSGPVSAGLLTKAPANPLAVLATDRVRVVCGRLDGAMGPRLLILGFPGGVNGAFDSAAFSLPVGWRGDFLDVAGPRTARDQAPNRPLGDVVVRFSEEPILRLKAHPTERPQFLGYDLAPTRLTVHARLGGARFDLVWQAVKAGLQATVHFADPAPGELLLRDSSGTRTVAPDGGDPVLSFPL